MQAEVEAAFPQFIVPEDRVEYPKQVGRKGVTWLVGCTTTTLLNSSHTHVH